MHKPFFTILIPTKNRSHLIGYAVHSVLNQTYRDFEIIVVDNDDSNKTEKVISNINDNRIKYHRTGNLNMCDNWEYALNRASGKYVTVLEDKQAYYPFALGKIKENLLKYKKDVFVWGWDIFNDNLNLAYKTSEQEDNEIITSVDILESYVKSPHLSWQYLPRMLNSCVSHDLIKEIKNKPEIDKFFSELSPDLCACFYILAHVNEISYTKKSMGLVGYFQLSSHNIATKYGKNKMLSYFGNIELSLFSVNKVPIKEHLFAYNSIYNDFLRIREKFPNKLQQFEMSEYNYAKMCFRDFSRVKAHENHVKTFASLYKYLNQYNLPVLPMFWIYIKELMKRKIGEIYWISNFRDKLKKSSWKAENILVATQLKY